MSKDALKTGRLATASKHELVRTLHDFLLSLVPLHGSAVLIIDEAQHLSPDVLEEIRILSNLETNDQKLLQIVIVGQLNLLDVLASNELRQLDQRISIRCSLKALSREEVEAYVTHRLWVARGATSVSFTPSAFDLVHAISGGVPRMINLLCDRALMAGSELQTSRIAEEHIVKAAGAVGHEIPKGKIRGERATSSPPVSRRFLIVAILGVVVVTAAAVMFFFGNPMALVRPGLAPAVKGRPTAAPPLRIEALAVPAEVSAIGPPAAIAGSFSVLVGTYDAAKPVAVVEFALRSQRLPIYLIDIPFAIDDIRRRVLVGRYRTREEADAVRQKLGPVMNDARVIPGEMERLRVVP